MSLPAARLGSTAGLVASLGVRIVLDARPLQEPDRAPLTAGYLDRLLEAYDADPLDGESFALLLRSDLDDPTTRFANLEVVGRRFLPPTHLLRSGALTVDPFVLSGASVGAAWRADAGGAAGAVYHAVGGAVPLATGLPLVVTLLDLAPWELPSAYQRSLASRFGQRLRGRLLRDAAAVIVGTDVVASAARRLLHLRRDRIRVIPFAPRPAFAFWPAGERGATSSASAPPASASSLDRDAARDDRVRLGLPERYLVYSGRYDARQDLATLLRAIEQLATAGRPDALADHVPWPPRVLLVGASPDDRASLARAASRVDVGETLIYAPRLSDERVAALVRGARAAILPTLSDEVVGAAGILVPPGEPERLASALATAWSDDPVHARLAAIARDRAETDRRTWADVATDTRRVYAEVGVRPS